jgi:hypothetical protein
MEEGRLQNVLRIISRNTVDETSAQKFVNEIKVIVDNEIADAKITSRKDFEIKDRIYAKVIELLNSNPHIFKSA